MIGLISNDIGVYSIIEKLQTNFPHQMIYFYNGKLSLTQSIELLINKKCKIIITTFKIEEEILNKYKEIHIFKLTSIESKNDYILNDEELIQNIDHPNLKNIKEILTSLQIKKNQNIIINNPKLLLIENIIKDHFKNHNIINNIDKLIEDITKEVDIESLEKVKEGTCIMIKDS